MLQVGKMQVERDWSKASRKGRFAPSRKVVGEMELEQSEQEREVCLNCTPCQGHFELV